jgi:flagellar motor protein MotB
MKRKPPIIQKNQTSQQVSFSTTKKNGIDINLNINLDDLRNGTEKKNKEMKLKIVTKLSVTQLAYFFRVLYLMKKIKASSQTGIMRFIAETFETDHVTEISSKSLRSKYYKVEDSEKTATRKQLMEIIEFIDKDRKL